MGWALGETASALINNGFQGQLFFMKKNDEEKVPMVGLCSYI